MKSNPFVHSIKNEDSNSTLLSSVHRWFHKYSLDSKSFKRCIKILISNHLYENYLGLYWHLANSGVRAHHRFLVYHRYTVVQQQYLVCAPERFARALPTGFSCKFDRSPYILL